MFKLSASLPQHVVQYILEAISNGELVDQFDRLPSETQLSRILGVSRATVREALAILAREGKVISRHGVGTFVNRSLQDFKCNISEVVEFKDLITQQGYQASVEVVSVETRKAGELSEMLDVAADEDVLEIKKLFMADQAPVILCSNIIPQKLILPNSRDNLLEDTNFALPIYRFLMEKCEQEVLFHMARINSTIASDELAKVLECEAGHPLLRITEVGFNNIQKPILYCLEHYRDELLQFHAIRKLVRPFLWEEESTS
jgi:GntR family transcriptional regulator